MPNDKSKDKVTRLRDVIGEFDSPEQAFQVARELHAEKVRASHADAVAPHGTMKVSNWEKLQEYMNALPGPDSPPLAPMLGSLSADLFVAIMNRDEAQLFTLLLNIAKAVKPNNLYARNG